MAGYVVKPLVAFISLALATLSQAEDQDDKNTLQLDKVYITGGADEINRQPGSAHLVDEEALEEFEYTDIHRVLANVPGVYIQEEDGYGLRPNIGLRGAAPHRSRKIALMEDGVLIGPAPYSAPAAYYFPNVARMQAVEVFKGPSAIKYGPNTVGGAINLVTRAIPYEASGALDIALGENAYRKLHAHYGDSQDNYGWMVEGLNFAADGFKDLDGGGDTGFERNDFLLKGRINTDTSAEVYQQLDIKLGYQDENSNETYLGLTQDDFDNDPYRRYAASQEDKMTWDHQQVQLTHLVDFGTGFSLTTDLYYHQFARAWNKLNGFNDSSAPTLNEILRNPTQGINQSFYDVLKGADSTTNAEKLVLGNNDRDYISQGVQIAGITTGYLGGADHELEIGLRYHQDKINRNHTEQVYSMVSGHLQVDSASYATTTNTGTGDALAVYIQEKAVIDDLTLTGGLRGEFIENELVNRGVTPETTIKSSENAIIWGTGAYYQLTESLGVLAGANKGFVASGPGQTADIDPEESINYELGGRFQSGAVNAEVIGFYNDYSNLKGKCSASANCSNADLDTETNAGAAEIYGIESQVGYTLTLPNTWLVPLNATYTYTKGTFQNDFVDSLNLFKQGANALIVSGDEMPLLPEHQLNLSAQLKAVNWQVNSLLKYVGDTRDQAGQGNISENELVEAHWILDLGGSYNFTANSSVYMSVDNVLDETYTAALRPYGARAGKPRTLTAGYKLSF